MAKYNVINLKIKNGELIDLAEKSDAEQRAAAASKCYLYLPWNETSEGLYRSDHPFH